MSDSLFPIISDFRVPKKHTTMNKLIALLLVGAAKLHANDDMQLLRAIAIVESGNAAHPEGDDRAIGKCGARGRHQLSLVCWAQHSKEPHVEAHKYLKSLAVALSHLRWLRKELEKDPEMGPGSVTPHHLACAWLVGPRYMHRPQTNKQITNRLEYAARVKNILKTLK